MGLTRVSRGEEPTNLYHLWFLTRGGELYLYEGGYENLFGLDFPRSLDGATSDRGAFVTQALPRSLATITRGPVLEHLGYDGLHEFGYFVGEDSTLYELSFPGDLVLGGIWRWGVNTTTGPTKNARGPVAVSPFVDGDGNEMNLVVYLDENGVIFRCESLLDEIEDSYYFSCGKIFGLPVGLRLDVEADLVAVDIPGVESPTRAYFLGRSTAGRLVLLERDGASWEHLTFAPPTGSFGNGLTAVMINYGGGEAEERIVAHGTFASGAYASDVVKLIYSYPYSASPTWDSMDPVLHIDASTEPGDIDSDLVPSRFDMGDGAGLNDALEVAGIAESSRTEDSDYLWRLSYRVNVPSTGDVAVFSADDFEPPTDVRNLAGGVLVEDFAVCAVPPASPPPTPGDCAKSTSRIFAVGDIGYYHGYMFSHENTVNPTDLETSFWTWQNLGTGHVHSIPASWGHLPHNELFLAEYDGDIDEHKGRMAAAGIVRESPFHVNYSASFDDGMSWVRNTDLPLPFVDSDYLYPDPGVLPETMAQFQTDPTIAFDGDGNGYLMVLGGINDSVDDAGIEDWTCIPRLEQPDTRIWMTDATGIYFYKLEYQVLGRSVNLRGPYWTKNEGLVSGEKYDHSWMVTRHDTPSAGDTTFLVTYMNLEGSRVFIQWFEADDVDSTAEGDTVVNLLDYPVKYYEEAEPVDLTGAPMMLVDDEGDPVILTIGNEICQLLWADRPDPTDPYDPGYWKCHKHYFMEDLYSIDAAGVTFEYRDRIHGSERCGFIAQMQPSAIASWRSGTGFNRLLFVYSDLDTDCEVEGATCQRIFLVYGDRDTYGWSFGSPHRISSGFPYGDLSHDIDPEVAVTEDGTVFVWWRTVAGEWDDAWECAEDVGGLVGPITVQQAAILRPIPFDFETYDYDFDALELISITNEFGLAENLPVHCGRGDSTNPEHFWGEYEASAGGRTHVHIPFSVPDAADGLFSSQMMHSVVTPWSY